MRPRYGPHKQHIQASFYLLIFRLTICDPPPHPYLFYPSFFFFTHYISTSSTTYSQTNEMDPTSFRHRRSPPTSDRLLRVFTFSLPSNANTGDELNEAELLWSGDVAERENRRPMSPTADIKRRPSFDRPQNSGIMDLLIEPDYPTGDGSVLCRKSSISSISSASMKIPSIPRPPGQNPQDTEYFSKSVPAKKFQQSAPVKVPVLSSKAMARRKNSELGFVDNDVEDDDEMLPPHEIVARGSGVSPKTTFSVLEGVGRTLKGRDLRQVRNAIWRKTGFLD